MKLSIFLFAANAASAVLMCAMGNYAFMALNIFGAVVQIPAIKKGLNDDKRSEETCCSKDCE